MKKIIIMWFCVMAACSIQCQATSSLVWGTDGAFLGSGPDLFGTDLSPLNATTGVGYVLKLYVYTGSGSPVADANPVSDAFITSATFIGNGDESSAIFLKQVDDVGPAGYNLSTKKIYTAIWDPSGTMYHILPNKKDIPTLDGSGTDPVSIDYNAGIQAATAYTVAVPEPSTIGLLLVGAGLVAFRRMRRS